MRTTKKILIAMALVLVFVAVLAVAVFADNTFPAGTDRSDAALWEPSGYKDIDDYDGWILYTKTSGNRPTEDGVAPQFVKGPGSPFYYNKSKKTGVLIFKGSVSSDSGEVSSVSRDNLGSKVIYLAFFMVDNCWTAIETHFASNDTVYSKSTGGAKLPTNLDETATANPWATLYVNKDNYLLMKDAFEKIDADESLDAAAKRKAKVTEATKYSGFQNNKNVLEKDALWTLAYLFKLMADDQTNYPLETLEIRSTGKAGTAYEFYNFSYTLTPADSVKTIYIDSRINRFQSQKNGVTADRGLFYGLAGLESLGHVVYSDMTGEFDTEADGATFEKGVVSLEGFKFLNSNGDNYTMGFFANCTNIKEAVWYATNMHGTTERAGYIDANTFASTTSLVKLTIPATVTLKQIKKEAFSGCTSLKTINILGAVASDMEIVNKNAFTGVSGLTINVNSNRNKIYMEKALENAGVTGVTVVNVTPPSELDNAIVADGYSIRQNDENAKTKGPALRAEFTLKASVVDNAEQTLVDFGVVVFSADTYENVYGSDIYAVYEAAVAGTDKRVIRKSAKNGPYVAVHDNGDITFAAAITKIPEDNYQSAIYTYAYAVWSDGTVGYTTYTSERTGKTAHSLYDMTIFAFRNGLLNSENTDADKLFPVLEKGALAFEGNIQSATADKAGDNTKFFDLPLYAHTNFSGYYSNTDTIEETSSTNILWSIFVDGDEYVVVYRKGNGEGTALLPAASAANTNVSHPWDDNYTAESAKSPALSNAAYKKIKTFVVDYGIEGVMINGDGALGAMPYVETIVYPNGFTNVHHYKRDWSKVNGVYTIDADGDGSLYDGSDNNGVCYLFASNTRLKDVIWANNDGIPHMADFTVAEGDTEMKHLVDLRGMGSVPTNQEIFVDTLAIENVVFGTKPKRLIYKNVFKSVTALERAWFETEHTLGETYEAPALKTIDISESKTATWCGFEGRLFGIKSDGYTVVLANSSAQSATWKESFFFGSGAEGEDNSALTVRVKLVDKNGNPTDPSSSFLGKIDSGVADRVYIYRATGDNAGQYVTTTGKVFSN